MAKTNNQPARRLAYIYDMCKGIKLCEGGDEMEKTDLMEGEASGEQKQVWLCIIDCGVCIDMHLIKFAC